MDRSLHSLPDGTRFCEAGAGAPELRHGGVVRNVAENLGWLGGEVELVAEEAYPPGKYSLLEG